MGMIRKLSAVSTMGLVSLHSPRENQGRAAVKSAKAAKIEARALKRISKS